VLRLLPRTRTLPAFLARRALPLLACASWLPAIAEPTDGATATVGQPAPAPWTFGADAPPTGPWRAAQGRPSTPASQISARQDERQADLTWRNAAIIGTGTALFAAYGQAKWWETGFGGGFKTTNEGWFGADTPYGGADKLGHMYTNYANVRLLTPLFEYAGNSREAAIRLAGWTTFGIFTGIEVLDGFSRAYQFSAQDAAMNIAGAALGVVLEGNPSLDDKFDFRFAYRRSPGSGFDPFGDYSGQRYLLVTKADGFAALQRHPVLRYLELGVGYQARGFDPGGERRRDLYVGISLNLSRLLADGFYGGQMHSTPFQRATDRVFDLIQFPTAGYVGRRLD
jgi:hypothetical protein